MRCSEYLYKTLLLRESSELMVKDKLIEYLKLLIQAHDSYCQLIEEAPDGKLLHSSGRYYLAVSKNGKYSRRGITKEPDQVRLYARKELLAKAVALLDHNIKVLTQAINNYKPWDPLSLQQSLSKSLRNLPAELFLDPVEDAATMKLDADLQQKIDAHKQWAAEPYSPPDFKSEGRTLRTTRGLLVRSKSEMLIAEKLYEYGIAFRYEQPLELRGGKIVHPDFTFEGAAGEMFYLEFCGMMDDEDYVKAFMHKRALYESNDINEWTNMIYVFASGNTIDMMQVQDMINNQIIPKL